MLALLSEIMAGFGHTIIKLLPYMAGMAAVFGVLSWISPCNVAKPWWQKRGIVTDLCYWFVVPVFTRYARIGFTVLFTILLFGIATTQGIAAFYDHGHGVLSRLPFWLQLAIYFIATDFALYWIHRGFHRTGLWKYHAVHHATEELDWISASRFHPVNLILGTVAVDVAMLLAGIAPSVFVFITPFNVLSGGWVHANLNWTLGPLKFVFAGPVFHRWHHARDKTEVNFASSLALFDVLFGTFYMPEGQRPQVYGIKDRVPESFGGQLLYPLLSQSETQV